MLLRRAFFVRVPVFSFFHILSTWNDQFTGNKINTDVHLFKKENSTTMKGSGSSHYFMIKYIEYEFSAVVVMQALAKTTPLWAGILKTNQLNSGKSGLNWLLMWSRDIC